MKEIIPLKKDIVFKTKIGEITNISLDHDYKINDDIVEGSVDISGSYKMTEASVIDEDFFYSIPFSIAISKRIKKDTIKIDVDDFKYDVIKDILKVSIELELTCEEEQEKEEEKTDDYLDTYFKEPLVLEEETDIKENIINNETNNNEINTNVTTIANNIINNENKYYTYKVYIVRPGDNYESICNKYNITMNDLKEYNNIDQINVGDKIIIPQVNE